MGCGDRGLLFFFLVLMEGEGGVDGLVFFFFFWGLMVDYGLLVVVVLGVCNVAVVGLW